MANLKLMGEIETTHLPGVGERHDFVTEGGDRVGIITHRDGRRELLFYDPSDPDRCLAAARLSEDDLRRLVELCGAC